MLAKAHAAAVWGVDALPVEIEVNATWGETQTIVVGLPDAAVRESKDRVRTALENSGFRYPIGKLTINLAPADVRKEGPSFDLPIAVGILAASEQLDPNHLADTWIVGELALSGEVRSVKGVLPITLEAQRQRVRRIIVPYSNALEGGVVEGIEVYGVRTLLEAVALIKGEAIIKPTRVAVDSLLHDICDSAELDFADVKGQELAKRAIEVAVAGGHNLLMIGPPGSGKSMLAKRIPTIFPPMTLDEALEITRIHSVVGLLPDRHAIIRHRPFRSPHHTVSDVGLIGGTATPTPGEVSLAHHGVLFLDELPEFKRTTLEVLRQPLEDGQVTISRAAGTMTFPAQFMLVAAMNPTPTGNFGDSALGKCSPAAVQRYLNKISGPLLDRIDIHIEVPAIKHELLLRNKPAEPSAAIRERVIKARAIQQERFKGKRRIRCNAQMGTKEIRQYCALTESQQELLRYALNDLNLSARAYDRILKVARTIADLAGEPSIQDSHIEEAIQYRTLDRQIWR
ncbi:MAG: YifB family Mg chelatase-like AAA ATPase [Methylacidiphilales bacterium]|nr:YifB family Mg chelatase-like AAA ATPase [Candidatus Methylacidiphilales bacterium]MDW8349706.1 YifB family Mg chelatase-like AAA ATPase [Verrucomicrobiae bacterium]